MDDELALPDGLAGYPANEHSFVHFRLAVRTFDVADEHELARLRRFKSRDVIGRRGVRLFCRVRMKAGENVDDHAPLDGLASLRAGWWIEFNAERRALFECVCSHGHCDAGQDDEPNQ